jgi:general secretion pathway protein C
MLIRIARALFFGGAGFCAAGMLALGVLASERLDRLRAPPAAYVPRPLEPIVEAPPRRVSADPTLARDPFESSRRPSPPPRSFPRLTRVGPYTYEMHRTTLDGLLEDQAQLMRSARVVPEQRDGKIAGVRIFGVRPGTLMDAIGFENGDMLLRVNGYDVTSPDHALEAYARLRSSDRLYVEIERRGTPITITYRIL